MKLVLNHYDYSLTYWTDQFKPIWYVDYSHLASLLLLPYSSSSSFCPAPVVLLPCSFQTPILLIPSSCQAPALFLLCSALLYSALLLLCSCAASALLLLCSCFSPVLLLASSYPAPAVLLVCPPQFSSLHHHQQFFGTLRLYSARRDPPFLV